MAKAKKKAAKKAAPKKKVTTKKAAPKKKAAKTAKAAKAVTPSLVGKPVPALSRPATGGGTISLKDFANRTIVLYFYPKDNTPGCTLESHDFRKLKSEFDREGAVILGVSKDSMKSHEKFKEGCGLPFELLSDEDEQLCRAFDVIKEKNLYGHKFMGIERSTFVIDRQGKIAQEWRKVKVDGHAKAVLDFIKSAAGH